MDLLNVNFDVRPAATPDICADHIKSALARKLPEADQEPLPHLTILANGPSAITAPLEGATLAVNGALGLFHHTGRTPTYWGACDPQEHVADFLPKNPPKSITYLIASKCHPAVFDRLTGCDVRVWHLDDYVKDSNVRTVKCASTITLTILTLMRKLGYRSFDVYGWDGCYAEPTPGLIQHHANEPALDSYPNNTIQLNVGATQQGDELIGGRTFHTTPTWAAEAKDAVIQLNYADYRHDIRVHGDGLIRAMLEAHAIIR